MKKGIDISYWQGDINFDKVKADGIEFAILREGFSRSVDAKFLEYVAGLNRVGIPIVGVYHFSYALTVDGAIEEAKSCIKNVQRAGLKKEDIIIFFDFEYDTVKKAAAKGVKLGRKECIAHTRAFCEYIESQGYRAGIYSNDDYRENMYDEETIEKYVYWFANWSGKPPAYECVYHQFTDAGKVNGINGNVDMNYYYGEKEDEGMYIKIDVASREEAEKLLALLKGAVIVGDEEVKPEPKPVVNVIKVGSVVRIKEGSKSYEGVNMAYWVFDKEFTVDALEGDRAVLDRSGICTAFHVNDLIFVK